MDLPMMINEKPKSVNFSISTTLYDIRQLSIHYLLDVFDPCIGNHTEQKH